MISPAVLVLSDDPTWLADAGEAVVRAGGVVVAECPDAVSVLAQAALDLGDVVLVDPRTLDLDRRVVVALRRRHLVVVAVSPSRDAPPRWGVPCLDNFAAALAWADRAKEPVTDTGEPLHPIVAVFGTRGAPGATTFATALAGGIAATQVCVALLDLDPRGGDVAHLLDLADDLGVVAATDAIAQDEPWAYTSTSGRLAVLGAPSRSWGRDVAPADIGLLLHAVRAEQTTVVDAGAVEAHLGDIATEVLACATHVLLVGRADRVALPHLMAAIAHLRPRARALTIVISQWRGAGSRAQIRKELSRRGLADDVVFVPDAASVDPLLEALLSGAEEQHQTRRGVQQHEDRHRHAGARLRLRLRAGRDG